MDFCAQYFEQFGSDERRINVTYAIDPQALPEINIAKPSPRPHHPMTLAVATRLALL